eukprot:1253599-Alexandrium_andersonii.AAC.1
MSAAANEKARANSRARMRIRAASDASVITLDEAVAMSEARARPQLFLSTRLTQLPSAGRADVAGSAR